MATTNLCVEVRRRIVIKMRLAEVRAPPIPQVYCYLLKNMGVITYAKIQQPNTIGLLLMFPLLAEVSWDQRSHLLGSFVTKSLVFLSTHTLHWL